MRNINFSKYCIVSGRYDTSSVEEKKMVEKIFGNDENNDPEYKYKLYFHWYNVIHEIGHVLMMLNDDKDITGVQEELLVNDFAVAYWVEFGEKEKIDDFIELIKDTLKNFDIPDNENQNYIEYATTNWGLEDLYTFNNYSWFQFNCVLNSLKTKRSLNDVLMQLINKDIKFNCENTFLYDINDTELVNKVISDAVKCLNNWGINMPILKHKFIDDPYMHCVVCE